VYCQPVQAVILYQVFRFYHRHIMPPKKLYYANYLITGDQGSGHMDSPDCFPFGSPYAYLSQLYYSSSTIVNELVQYVK
jgi:hypothetical protein